MYIYQEGVIVIRILFRRKTTKVRSLISLIALAVMFMLLCLFIPEFFTTTSGQVFVGVWALIAALSFSAHTRNVRTREGRQYVPVYGIKKTGRAVKRAHPVNSMRGL